MRPLAERSPCQRLKGGGARARQRDGRALRVKRARHGAAETARGAGDEGR